MPVSILRLPEVQSRTGLSRSSIYLRISRNEFPASVSIGARAVGWSSKDIDQWIEQQLSNPNSGTKQAA